MELDVSDPAEDGRDVDLELAADPTTDPPAESESPINIETNTSDVMSLDEDSDVSGQDGAGVQTEDDKTAPDGLDGHQRTADTPEGIIIVDSDEDSAMDDNILPSSPSGASRYLPIQVVLTPPSDPSSYEKVVLPTSWFVSRVLEEIQAGGELWYSVEFDDGRVDQVAHDDLVAQENGLSSLDRFQRGRGFASTDDTMPSNAAKRRHDDDSDAFDSEDDQPRLPGRNKSLRRSSRHTTASRRASVASDIDDGMEDLQISQFIDDDDDDDLSSRAKQGLGPNRRLTRAQNSKGKRVSYSYNAALSSEDELANDDSDNFVPVTSDVVTIKRSSARKRRGRPRASLRSARESSIEFEATRKSGRARKDANYIVPDVDDEYYAAEEKAVQTPKHVSVKEIFAVQPADSDFVRMHTSTCDTCGGGDHTGKGHLIHCQGCSYSYHKVCLGLRSQREHRVTKVGTDNFVLQCRVCIGTYQAKDARAPNYAKCQVCDSEGASCHQFSTKRTPKTEERLRQENGGEDPITRVSPELLNNTDTLLFRCTTCKRGYHFEHLPPLTPNEVDPEDLRKERVEEYSLVDWRCKDCVNAKHNLQGLVAWRPADQQSYVRGQTCLDMTEDQLEYLIKWDKCSHFHDSWMPGAWVAGTASSMTRQAFNRRDENMLPKMTTAEAINEEWLLADVLLMVKFSRQPKIASKAKDLARISDVKEIYVKFQGLPYTEAVWDVPPPKDSGAAWDAFRQAYEDYVQGLHFPYVSEPKMAERIRQYRDISRRDFERECRLQVQPAALKKGELMEYQLKGVNWLLYNFYLQQSIILADEMGLGKTIQVVSMIAALVTDKPNCWPFLIVVPSSTCPNWRRELKQWAPELRAVSYYGGAVAQSLAFKHELFPDGVKAGMKAHVVIMSYEAAVDAKSTFRSVKWAGLIVDEGQRLKNDASQLYLALADMRIPFRLLLTGTPLQNNKRELFNLLQFVDRGRSAEELDNKYAEITKDNINELHELIRPYFFRRTKAEVLKFLPPMAQVILPVTMTYLQERLSKSIIAKNAELIKAIVSKGRIKVGERKGLSNILMELRRVLCHPFLFSDSVEDRTVTDPAKVQQNLVEASGKLLLLNIMLPKLKERGHRVLIFSQFLMSLTILEDFLTALGLPHARIDGSCSSLEKQRHIDAFNDPESPLFAMLLSTRAGGVGINLATADTVIIYDPDFNPHQDIQALSRAHRIGQKKKVLCFQLTTKDTVEERIMQIGRKKMALDHALIGSMDAPDDAGDDLESILKHGAEALFSDDAREKITYDEASVDKLLDRSQIENTQTNDETSAESQFSFARVWANDEGRLASTEDDTADGDRPADHSVWENILKQRQEEHEREVAAQQQEYGRGARRRQEVRYDVVGDFIEDVNDHPLTLPQPHIQGDVDGDGSSDEDREFRNKSSDEDDEDEYDENPGLRALPKVTAATPPAPPALPAPPAPPAPPMPPIPPMPRNDALTMVLPSTPQPPVSDGDNPKPKRRPRPKPGDPPRPRGRPRKNLVPVPVGARTDEGQYKFRVQMTQPPPHPMPMNQAIPNHPPMAQELILPGFIYTPRGNHVANNGLIASHMMQQQQPRLQPGHPHAYTQHLPDRTQFMLRQNQINPHNRPVSTTPVPPPELPSSRPNTLSVQGATPASRSQATCLFCNSNHPPARSCIDLNSELSIRIALDNLKRNSKADPVAVQNARDQLSIQLRSLKGGPR